MGAGEEQESRFDMETRESRTSSEAGPGVRMATAYGAYTFLLLIVMPVVVLAPSEIAPLLGLAAVLLLYLHPRFASGNPSRAEPAAQLDGSAVIHHELVRKGSAAFKIMAAMSAGLFLATLLGGGLVDFSWFALFPWSLKAAFFAVGLYVLSPQVLMTRVVLVVEGEYLKYTSRKHPHYSTAYQTPSEVRLDRISRARLTYYPVYRGESAFHLMIEGDRDNIFPGSTTLLAEIWIDRCRGAEAKEFLERLGKEWPGIEVDADLRPNWQK